MNDAQARGCLLYTSCGDLKEIERVFGYTVDKEKGKPSNREYIARMADSLRIAQT